MKCKAKVKLGQTPKLKKGQVLDIWLPGMEEYGGLTFQEPDWPICDGKIMVRVDAIEEPYYGGTSAELAVSYTCERCGNTSHDLPDSWGLGEFLTSLLAALSDKILQDVKRDIANA